MNERPTHSALVFARFLTANPGAAAGITRLALPTVQPLSLDVVAALLRRCASLRRLLNAPRAHDQALRVLRNAAEGGCPLEHAHLHTVTPALVDALLRFTPTLRSVFVSHDAGLTRSVRPRPDFGALARLLCSARLTRVELDINSLGLSRLRCVSDTLQELVLGGKHVVLAEVCCPQLTTLRFDGWAPFCHSAARRAAVVAGCPRLKDIDIEVERDPLRLIAGWHPDYDSDEGDDEGHEDDDDDDE